MLARFQIRNGERKASLQMRGRLWSEGIFDSFDRFTDSH